jgi:hypothetical protein
MLRDLQAAASAARAVEAEARATATVVRSLMVTVYAEMGIERECTMFICSL